GGQRIYVGMIDGAGEHQAGVTAAGIGPGIIAGNANDEDARELIIAAGLDAAEETIRVVAPLRLSEPGRERRIANGPFFASPHPALAPAARPAAAYGISTRQRIDLTPL